MTNILIIEDDREINRLIESTLISEGYSCESEFDGKEGADRLRQTKTLTDTASCVLNLYQVRS